MNVWIAAADGKIDLVRELVECKGIKADQKDENGYTPLHAAAEYNHLDIVEYLLSKYVDINIVDSDGDTPLHATESAETAKYLVSLGADFRKQNIHGLTPLQKAECEGDFPELIAYLRELAGMVPVELPENLPEDVQVRLTESQEPAIDIDPAERQELADIIEHGTDAQLEQFLRQRIVGTGDHNMQPTRKVSRRS